MRVTMTMIRWRVDRTRVANRATATGRLRDPVTNRIAATIIAADLIHSVDWTPAAGVADHTPAAAIMGAGLCRNEGDDAEDREKSKDVFHSDELGIRRLSTATSPAYSCTTKLFSITRSCFSDRVHHAVRPRGYSRPATWLRKTPPGQSTARDRLAWRPRPR